MRRVLVTGVTGFAGSHLVDYMLERGDCEIVGIQRWRSRTENIEHFADKITLLECDLRDAFSTQDTLQRVRPDFVFHLAAQSFVPTSWAQPVLTAEFDAVGVTRLLEAVRLVAPETRVYQASSSEMFGRVRETPQRETTPFYPRSPYGVAKVYAHYITVNYRESYRLFACSAMGFNHESPRRGLEFVTRKVTHQVARIKCGLAKKLSMGNLDAQRDWGFAGDYVRAMWLALQQPEADDYVLATGKTHSIRELLTVAFGAVGLHWEEYVEIDPKLIRPAEVEFLCGDATKAREKLGWESRIAFPELVKIMVDHDLELAQQEQAALDFNGSTANKKVRWETV